MIIKSNKQKKGPLVRGIHGSGFGTVPKCHGSATSIQLSLPYDLADAIVRKFNNGTGTGAVPYPT